MSDDSKILTKRRRFLTGVGVVATGATLAASASAQQSRQGSGFVPARHDLDTWMDEMSGIHRAFVDSASGAGGANALNYANNILLGHREDYGGSDSDYALIVCFRHSATPFGYNDAMWEKYGEFLSRVTATSAPGSDEPMRVNPMNVDRASWGNRGNTIDKMHAQGVRFAVCKKATRSLSSSLARSTGRTEDEIFEELTSNGVIGSHFVAAGVIAATRSQEYGYSLLSAG